MTAHVICIPCQHGSHDRHIPVPQPVPKGVYGGSRCYCGGECRDGRYKPAWAKNPPVEVAPVPPMDPAHRALLEACEE